MAGTRWVKLDLSYLRNPKVTAVSPSATLLHLASILWTADELKDGNLPGHILPDLAHMARMTRATAAKRADELVKAGLWEVNGSGWVVHDFAKMNPQAMRAAVEEQRRKWRGYKSSSRVESTEDSAVESGNVPGWIPPHESVNDYEW